MNIFSRIFTDRASDRFDAIAGVSFFVLMAYLLSGTHVVMAIICLFFACTMPFIVKSSRRVRDKIYGSQSDANGMGV